MRIKGFDKDLKCRGFQFEVGKTYDTGANADKLEFCTDKVFHYCDCLQNIHNYYDCTEDNRYCEIEVLGKEISDGKKYGSNKIKVVREIVGEELDILKGRINGNTGVFNTGHRNTGDYNTGHRNTGDFNTGHRNTGHRNTGDYNTGHRNTGDFNTGHRNTGDYNTGYRNTGDCNTGDYNTGDCNTGDFNTGHRNTGDYNTGYRNTGHRNTRDCNTGDYNTGHRNTGDYNTGDCNTGDCNTGGFNSCNNSAGFFCTEEPKARVFNVEIDMTVSEFRESKYCEAICSSKFNLTEWVEYSDEEKSESKENEVIGGYLKKYTFKEACSKWWSGMSEENKKIVMSIPNFDKKIFKEITGVEV